MRTRLLVAVLVAGVAASGATAMGGGRALASHVSCGDTITADTTLDSDLVDCPNNGIVIGADDITLDLNGHTIDGDGKPLPACDPEREICDVGVLNDGHDGVTVRDGSVREFDSGVLVGEGTREPRAGHLLVKNTFFGFVVFSSAQKPGPRQLGKPQHRSRGGRDGLVRLA